jgi:hypothetical protein
MKNLRKKFNRKIRDKLKVIILFKADIVLSAMKIMVITNVLYATIHFIKDA